MQKPIFILGIPRSGSTFWAKILSASDELAFINEMKFFWPWYTDFRDFCRSKIGDLKRDENVLKLINLLLSDKYFPGINSGFWRQLKDLKFKNPSIKRDLYEAIIKSDRSFESIFKSLIEIYTRYVNKKRCFVKFPMYFNYIPKLIELYPECKIIHITRDPRAIAISKTRDPGGTAKIIKRYPRFAYFIKKSMIYFAVTQYIWSAKIHSKYKNLKNYTLFRYEDLLVNPEKVINKLCEFCEIRPNRKMFYPSEGQPSSITGKKIKGFDKEAAIRWQKIISPFDKKLITFLTKKSMKKLGYDPDNHPIFQIATGGK